ncbi:MAG TPA: hypothetical protein VJR92_06440 [Gemmatimonadaceae bacterium]|nr:hypothetical protein [Gemmatimonadaceae bacterium]
MRNRRAMLIAVAAVATASCGSADTATPRLNVTYMVDTTHRDKNEIFKLWRDYLDARTYTYEPKPQWSAAEQKLWPIFDLAMPQVYANDDEYRRTYATVFDISPASTTDSSEYFIRTLFTRPQLGASPERSFIIRVYATREDGRWVLANALPRLTKSWKRTAFGSITYVHPPEHRVDTARATRAIAFTDSLVKEFGAPPLKPITYYLARTPEEAFAIGGIELYIPGSRARVVVADYLVFSGVPSIGEFYAHELVHLTLGATLAELQAPQLLDEALALWLGGGREMTWPQIRDELATEMRRDPSWTLERLLEEQPETFLYRNTAAAALLVIAHERGGVSMLKEALRSQPTRGGFDYIGGVMHATKMSRAEVEAAFRRLVTDPVAKE